MQNSDTFEGEPEDLGSNPNSDCLNFTITSKGKNKAGNYYKCKKRCSSVAQTLSLSIFRVHSPTFNPPTWIRDAAFAYLAVLTDNRKGSTSQIKISLPVWSVHFRHQATRIGIILVGKISIYASLWCTCCTDTLLRWQKDRGKPSASGIQTCTS